ncbi:MAG: ETC complex I subunit [Alphaproteobacteria bacterium]|uniref:ETC complex I subunit n=1 Tax=Futiania mangrovi TaxID=2959716 RepID=A0A9J6PE56_9PROT|nr:ETC complex I subunit [Futiania mangrovii]MCP1336027.1 ETC complex I subunit [Futiania mangrovii]MDX5360430.1 ETC complex I subunit [Alphaproteobacteria bacterium]MDX5368567.1 ETC complex I subunit [Alphaproteobacteria bacterium]MDX5463318.1 ETC complex I subunit [Alphaproteobacteria bacterium]
MVARIYKPAKTAMQSGKANTRKWVLEFEPEEKKRVDPLMGWTGSGDTQATQVKLRFETKEGAIDYAKRHGIAFRLVEPHEMARATKSYSANFAFNRREQWSH